MKGYDTENIILSLLLVGFIIWNIVIAFGIWGVNPKGAYTKCKDLESVVEKTYTKCDELESVVIGLDYRIENLEIVIKNIPENKKYNRR